ncbi:pinensin family lanthipeptide [Xanthovirga aplysinae]
MKKKKLKLDQIKLESFVTSLEKGKENTVKGGAECEPGLTCLNNIC